MSHLMNPDLGFMRLETAGKGVGLPRQTLNRFFLFMTDAYQL